MSRYPVANQIPPPRVADGTATAGWARWVRDKWQAVRVTHLKTVPLAADIHGPVRVRVNVHLGGLAPADVLVEATADRTETADASGGWPVRLCSMQSYGNGTYVFEGLLPPQAGEEHYPVTVRVRPAAAHEALSALREVGRLFDARFDGTPAPAVNYAAHSRREPLVPVG